MIDTIVQTDGHVNRRRIAEVKQTLRALRRDGHDVAAAVDRILEMMAYAKGIVDNQQLKLNPFYPASCLLAIRTFKNSKRGRVLLSLMPEVNTAIIYAHTQVDNYVNGINGAYS